MADDWWDDMYDDAGEQKPMRKQRPKRTRTSRGSSALQPERIRVEVTRPAAPERESIRDAARALLPTDPQQARRWRHAAYNGSAAAAGWLLGLAPAMHSGMADSDSTTTGVWMGVGLIIITATTELRTHTLRDPGRHHLIQALGWAFRIPLASAVLALALFTPDAAL